MNLIAPIVYQTTRKNNRAVIMQFNFNDNNKNSIKYVEDIK